MLRLTAEYQLKLPRVVVLSPAGSVEARWLPKAPDVCRLADD